MLLVMDNAIPLLQERLAKAEVKAARAEKAWETAKNEVADLNTAIRVMSELTGEAVPTTPSNAAVVDRQRLIVNLLQVGEQQAQSPAELFDTYKIFASEDINIDTFRTTIWRMRDKDVRVDDDIWLVKGAHGKYWKVPGTLNTRARYEAAQQTEIREARGDFDALLDDDSEPPF